MYVYIIGEEVVSEYRERQEAHKESPARALSGFSLGKLTPLAESFYAEGCWRENVQVDSGLLRAHRCTKNVRRAFLLARR